MEPIVNPWVSALEPYVPGEQPREPGFVKLNTNECPYPPSLNVTRAIHEATADALFQKYPDPISSSLRKTIAEGLGVRPSQVLAGNGSDEILRLVCHAFLRPMAGDRIAMLDPTYVLYQTLAAMYGCASWVFPVTAPDYTIPDEAFQAPVRIFFLPNPNPPIGTLYPHAVLKQLIEAVPERLVVLDEAYVDFAGSTALEFVTRYPNVLVSRTFSKSYALAGLRVGFCIANEGLIEEMDKIRDSYNLNRLSQAAAEAAFRDTSHLQETVQKIRADREWLVTQLTDRGFQVPESHGNFLFARRPDAAELYTGLKEMKVLVRYFKQPSLRDGIRITIGTRPELETLINAIDALSE